MAFTDRLKSIFGWPTARRPMERPTLKDIALQTQQVQSAADRYHSEMDFLHRRRQDRYDVYDAMDEMADVSSVLDAYAEDATQIDQEHEKSVWVTAKKKQVREILSSLLHDTLHIEDTIEGICRDVAKMGDDFGVLNADRQDGVKSILWRDPRDIERIENRDGILIGFEEVALLGSYKQRVMTERQQGRDGSAIKPTYEPWNVIHFRILKKKRLPKEKQPNIYGTSVLAGSERIAKQVKILDDLLMIMRLTRSLDRKTYYVDVGRSPVEEEIHILRRWKRALKRKTYFDPATGRFDSRFDPFAWTEDEFWPIKENRNSRVETQPGITNIADIVDIDHFRDKFFGSLRAPKAYFGYEGDVNARATLASQSLKWARAVSSIQRAVKQGLTRLCQIHLAYLNMDTDAEQFEIHMTQPSIVELLDKLEAWQNVVDVAERMSTLGETLQLDKYDWTVYILENVMWLSKDEVRKFARKIPKEEPPPEEQPGMEPQGAQPQEPPQPFGQPFTQPGGAPQPADMVGAQEQPPPAPGESIGRNGVRRASAEVDRLILEIHKHMATRIPLEN